MAASIADFVKCPKKDAFNHLNLGMRYASYAPWAGFYIPDFPRKICDFADAEESVFPYTDAKCQTMKDVQDLFSLSVRDAISDCTKIISGGADFRLINQCGGARNFCEIIKRTAEKYSDKIDFRAEFLLGEDFKSAKKDAMEALETGVFKSVSFLLGDSFFDDMADFRSISNFAEKHGVLQKMRILGNGALPIIKKIAGKMNLAEIMCAASNFSAPETEAMKILSENGISLTICPECDSIFAGTDYFSEAKILRSLLDFGVRVNLGTGFLLVLNKNISEQCVSLVQTGIFSVQEMQSVLSSSIKS